MTVNNLTAAVGGSGNTFLYQVAKRRRVVYIFRVIGVKTLR